MTDLTIGIAVIAFLCVMVLLGFHIAFALLTATFVGMMVLTSYSVTESLLVQTAHSALSDFVFSVIPLFILMGAFMTNSKAASDLYSLMHVAVKRILGGLAVATVLANAAFASVTGVSIASATVFSRIAFPEMRKHGYDDRLALGTIASSSLLGMLIPPSALLILYGLLTQVSIGKLFIAGIVPGLLLAAMLAVFIVIRAYRNPALVGADVGGGEVERADEDEASLGVLLLRAIPIVVLMLLVIGGIWTGYFSATEAAAVGAVGGMIAGFMRGMRLEGFLSSLRDAAIASGAILILLIAAQMYTRMLALSGMVKALGDSLLALTVPSWVIVALFVLVIIILGAILDSTSIILLTVPMFFPIITVLGLDPVWFGIVVVVAVEIGLITPPFGMVLFAMAGVLGNQTSVERIFRGSFPFVLLLILFVAILMAFPALSLWLPGIT